MDTGQHLYPNEPTTFQKKDLNQFLLYCFHLGASDITIKNNECIFCEIHGRFYRVTRKHMSKSEVMNLITEVSGGEAIIAHLNGGDAHDCSYAVKEDRENTVRFRVNIIGILSEGHTGYEMTMRTIDGNPKPIDELHLDAKIFENFAPQKGMVLVTGATGSGKSTLLSSIIRYLLEQEDGNRKIITYEAPIEFVYDNVNKPSSIITQSEVGKNIKNFADALRSALRRKPNVILIGEMRDKETITEGVIASMTGHLLYSTLHTNGVADTIRRMVGVFPTEEKNSAAIDILSSLRMIIGQQLIPTVDGKRVAIREYLVFNDNIIDRLFNAGVDNLAIETRKILKEEGQPFVIDAEKKFKEGVISEIEFKKVQAISLGQDKDLKIM